ncbi:kelch repeat and BTB domain-containing protein 2-like [Anneissia japonica]|uniref:kelch repeat and BTB domain-containing protein 2-like n=1 Tax=Anneissia japonica TaxID=1529436 RepID=UPI0014255585|nr:kelch repeat and BTB domain-containing protein 2-like [Anneissia japonica]
MPGNNTCATQSFSSYRKLVIKNTSEDHVRILTKLYEAQKSDFLTDVTIVVDECAISCHAQVLSSASGYVRNILQHGNIQNSEIPLQGISKITLTRILEYIYTGRLLLTRWYAKDLLERAIFLQLPELVQVSRDFLKSSATSHEKIIDHSSIIYHRIVQTFKKLWNDSATTDVVVTSNSTDYFCHRLVLSVRSDYFYAMFGSNMEENCKRCAKLDQIDPLTLGKTIAYLYYQNVVIEAEELFDLMEVADMLQMQNLCIDISKSVMKEITVENSIAVFMFSSLFHVYRPLCEATKKYIQQNFLPVSEHENFLYVTDVNLIDIVSTSNILLHSPIVLLKALNRWYKHDLKNRTNLVSNVLKVLKTHLNPSSYSGLDLSCNYGPEIQMHLSGVKFYRQLSPLQRLRPALNVSANGSEKLAQNETIVMFVWTPSAENVANDNSNAAPAMQRLHTCCFHPDSNSNFGSWFDYDSLQIVPSQKDSTYSMWTSLASLGNGTLLAVTQQRQLLVIELSTNSARSIPPPCILKSYCQVVSLDNHAYLLVIDDTGYGSLFGYDHELESWKNLSPPPSKISMSYRPIFAECIGKIFLIEEFCEQVYEPTLDLWSTRKHTSIPSFQKLRDMRAVPFNEFLILSNWNNFYFYDTFTGFWAKGNSDYQGIPLKCRGSLFSILPDFLTGLLTVKHIPSISASKEQLSISSKNLSNHIIGIQCVAVPAVAITKDLISV